jgi:hypothetical protein
MEGFLMKMLMACVPAFALVGVLSACGDDEEEAGDRLQEACESFCDASLDGCEVGGIDADQCKNACPYLETQLDGHCVAEYTAVFECGVQGGFTCGDNGPIPNDPCLDQTVTWSECMQGRSCAQFCEAAQAAGCPPGGSASACTAECNATLEELDVCSSSYDFYLQCTDFDGLSCNGSTPTSSECDEDLLDVGECLASAVGACEGYCFSSEVVGCTDGATCETTCAATRDENPSCSQAYESWLQCVVDDFEPTCNGTELTATSCDAELGAYQTCLDGG